jgi:hypothetical protein
LGGYVPCFPGRGCARLRCLKTAHRG